MKISKELIDFVYSHRHDDPTELALRKDRHGDFDYASAVTMIVARQRLEQKLPEWAAVPEVLVPSTVMVEQASSSETATYKAEQISGARLVIDLSGGLGVDSAAFAKVADGVHYVEKDPERVAFAKHNFAALGLINLTTHVGSAEKEGLQLITDLKPDLIFIDPDRRPDPAKGRTYLPEACTPDVTTLLPIIFDVVPEATVWIKFSPMLDITQLYRSVEGVTEVHVVSYKRECKELLVRVRSTPSPEQPKICAVELLPMSHDIFPANESITPVPISSQTDAHWLYEPFASIAKIGLERFGPFEVWKPDVNTHLYLSREKQDDFPGRCFEVEEQGEWSKKVMRRFEGSEVHLVAKNFPEKSETLRTRLKTVGRGDRYLFLFRMGQAKRYLLTKGDC